MTPHLHRIFCASGLVGGSVACVLALAGCQTAPVEEKFQTYGWEEHRMPNTPQPYGKLLVEIDAVKGTEPTARELADLRSFLEEATAKPGGIIIKVDNIIPKSAALGRTPQSLALEYLNGPRDDDTALIYILCYRSGLGRLFAKADKPYFTYFPYPGAIFIDRSYAALKFWFYHRKLQRFIMRHEVGHALGLARNSDHSSRGHCTNDGCIMRTDISFNYRRFLTFRPPLENTELCAGCRHDLEDYKSAQPKSGERLWQEYFVHTGTGYHVLTLPSFVYVHFGDLEELRPEKVAEARREAITTSNRRQWHLAGSLDVADDLAAIGHFIAEQRENEVLRDFAELLIKRCITEAEAAKETDPERAKALACDDLIAIASEFPELEAKLRALQAIIAASPIRSAATSAAAAASADPKRP